MKLTKENDDIDNNKFALYTTAEKVSLYIRCTLFGYRVAVELNSNPHTFDGLQLCCGAAEGLTETTYATLKAYLEKATYPEVLEFIYNFPISTKKPFILDIPQVDYFKKLPIVETDNLNIKQFRKQFLNNKY
jgi:hypothetical protein